MTRWVTGVPLTRRTALVTALAGAAAVRTTAEFVDGGGSPRHGVLTDEGAASVHDLIAAARTGAVVELSRSWEVELPVVIDTPLTLRFVGGSITSTRDITLIRVIASDVRIEHPVLTGPGGRTAGLGRAVHVVGTVDRPCRGFALHGGVIRGFSHDGVLLEHTEAFAVTGADIKDVGYAGILLFSCADGVVSRNLVDGVHQPSPYVNSYGIEAVRATAAGLDVHPRCRRISVTDNTVRNVRHWEGIDTHGGIDIAILRNRVEECRVGIAIVPSKDEADAAATKYAPLSCSVVGNTISRSWRGPGSGIVVRGAGETVGSGAERATGSVRGNTVSGYGDGTRDAAVLVYLTRDLVVAQNDLRAHVRGIGLYHSNSDVVVARNHVRELTTTTGMTMAIHVQAGANTGVVVENTADVGDVGLHCRQTPNTFLSVSNRWRGAAMLPVSAIGSSVLQFRDQTS